MKCAPKCCINIPQSDRMRRPLWTVPEIGPWLWKRTIFSLNAQNADGQNPQSEPSHRLLVPKSSSFHPKETTRDTLPDTRQRPPTSKLLKLYSTFQSQKSYSILQDPVARPSLSISKTSSDRVQVACVQVLPAFRSAKMSPGMASKMVSNGTLGFFRHDSGFRLEFGCRWRCVFKLNHYRSTDINCISPLSFLLSDHFGSPYFSW